MLIIRVGVWWFDVILFVLVFWFGVACSLIFLNVYIYIYIGILEESREMFGLGGPSCPWMRSQNRFRTVGVDFCSLCRASNFLLQVIYGEEWWTCKNTSPIFFGCRQFRKLSRRLDKYNVLQRWGNYFLTPQYRVCNWFDVILVLDMLKVFCIDITPLELITATIFTPFVYHLIIQVKFYSPYCNSPFPMIPSRMIPSSYLSSHISSMLAQESPSSVEPWVVRAISEGVIDGRIDQLNRKVPGMKVMRRWWLLNCRYKGSVTLTWSIRDETEQLFCDGLSIDDHVLLVVARQKKHSQFGSKSLLSFDYTNETDWGLFVWSW